MAAATLPLFAGCEMRVPAWIAPQTEEGRREIADADTAFTFVRGRPSQSDAVETRPGIDCRIHVLHVQIPRSKRRQVEKVWNHLREDVLAAADVLRLRENGVRVGLGRGEWWDAVKAGLDAIEGQRVSEFDPVRIPPGYPLGLELDAEPRQQTLFFVGSDGLLSGETWPDSRNVLRLMYTRHAQRPEHIVLEVVPEVRQRLDGWQWIRTESGLWQAPRHNGRAFAAAAFSLAVGPGEFLVIAPSEPADVFGLLGGAFLTSVDAGERFDSYVFIRPEVVHVGERS